MNKLDVYYRAFKNYRKETLNVKECVKDRKAIKTANIEDDKLLSTKYLCLIDEEWLKQIEEGLEFVQKAIEEGRQFIRTNSEVVPIEKAKKISRESVEHLAKHSDMITRLPDNPEDNLVPDEILMVEKLTDFAIYENRFLYMLLVYLVHFIDFRLEKIEKLRSTYLGDFFIKKQVETKGSTLDVEIILNEKKTNNPFPLIDSRADDLLRRVKDCKYIINSLLATELMQSVSKSPMLKPPITKTNVLKMNNNFKRSLALYEYVASYKGEGFTAQEVLREYHPFDEEKGDEVAEVVNLAEFVSYKYGNELSSYLESNYQKEELLRKEEESKKIQEQIRRLKKRVEESGKSMEEYMLMLENRNKTLEHAEEELARAREEIIDLNAKIDNLTKEKELLINNILDLEKSLKEKNEEIDQLNEKYNTDMEQLRVAHIKEVEDLNIAREKDINNIMLIHSGELDDVNNKYIAERGALTSDYEAKVLALTNMLNSQTALRAKTVEDYQRKLGIIVAGFDKKVEDLETQIKEAKQERTLLIYDFENRLKGMQDSYNEMVDSIKNSSVAEIESLKAENKALKNYASFFKGELTAIRVQQGLITPCDEFTTRQRFNELEEEYIAFRSFFKAQWKLTKRAVRDTIKD